MVDGSAATRFEPGAVPLTDLVATRAVAAVLHAELARHVPVPGLPHRQDRWGRAERVAFGEARVPTGALGADGDELLRVLADHRDGSNPDVMHELIPAAIRDVVRA